MQRPLNLVCPLQILEFALEGYFIKEVLLAEIGRQFARLLSSQTLRSLSSRGWSDSGHDQEFVRTASDALGNPPFAVLDNWSELPVFYAPYSNAAPKVIDEIEGRRPDVYKW
jgi:hypothetical protein